MFDDRHGRLTGAAIVVVAFCGLWRPESAAGATAGATLQYTCMAVQSMTAQLTWNPPPEIVAGKPVPAVSVTATATIDATGAQLLGDVGIASLDGSGDTASVMVAPEGTIDTPLHLVVPPSQVPASGQMTFHAAGTLTGLLFRQPGHAAFDVGPTLDLTLTPRDANGNSLAGAVPVSCPLNPGQSREAFAFDIAPTPAPVTPATTTRPVPTGTRVASAPGPGGGSRSSMGGSSTAGPSSSGPPATLPTAPVATRTRPVPVRDSAAVSHHRRLPGGWWLPVAGTVAVVAGAVVGVRRLRGRHPSAETTDAG